MRGSLFSCPTPWASLCRRYLDDVAGFVVVAGPIVAGLVFSLRFERLSHPALRGRKAFDANRRHGTKTIITLAQPICQSTRKLKIQTAIAGEAVATAAAAAAAPAPAMIRESAPVTQAYNNVSNLQRQDGRTGLANSVVRGEAKGYRKA